MAWQTRVAQEKNELSLTLRCRQLDQSFFRCDVGARIQQYIVKSLSK